MKKHVALAKAGREWGKHLNVSKSTIEDIYKTDKLDAARAKALREFFSDATESDVIAAISDYCRNHE